MGPQVDASDKNMLLLQQVNTTLEWNGPLVKQVLLVHGQAHAFPALGEMIWDVGGG